MTDPDAATQRIEIETKDENDYHAPANPSHVSGERHLDHVGPPVADATEWLRPPTTASEVTAEDDA